MQVTLAIPWYLTGVPSHLNVLSNPEHLRPKRWFVNLLMKKVNGENIADLKLNQLTWVALDRSRISSFALTKMNIIVL